METKTVLEMLDAMLEANRGCEMCAIGNPMQHTCSEYKDDEKTILIKALYAAYKELQHITNAKQTYFEDDGSYWGEFGRWCRSRANFISEEIRQLLTADS